MNRHIDSYLLDSKGTAADSNQAGHVKIMDGLATPHDTALSQPN